MGPTLRVPPRPSALAPAPRALHARAREPAAASHVLCASAPLRYSLKPRRSRCHRSGRTRQRGSPCLARAPRPWLLLPSAPPAGPGLGQPRVVGRGRPLASVTSPPPPLTKRTRAGAPGPGCATRPASALQGRRRPLSCLTRPRPALPCPALMWLQGAPTSGVRGAPPFAARPPSRRAASTSNLSPLVCGGASSPLICGFRPPISALSYAGHEPPPSSEGLPPCGRHRAPPQPPALARWRGGPGPAPVPAQPPAQRTPPTV
jgi:hypothetical protein